MVRLAADTPEHVERMQIEGLRQMPAWRKLALVGGLNQAVRRLALSGLRQRHPDDTEMQRRRRLADLLLGPELAAKVYGPCDVVALIEAAEAANLNDVVSRQIHPLEGVVHTTTCLILD